jgi:ketosteroid isomerase-like protein
VSHENVELVRSIYSAWERGDYRSADWADPNIEFVIDDGISSTRHAGVPAMSKAWREFLAQWTDWRTEVEEYRELDRERVLVLLSVSGRGRRSGVDLANIRQKGANLFELRNGVVRGLSVYLDRDRAPADLDLTPESD